MKSSYNSQPVPRDGEAIEERPAAERLFVANAVQYYQSARGSAHNADQKSAKTQPQDDPRRLAPRRIAGFSQARHLTFTIVKARGGANPVRTGLPLAVQSGINELWRKVMKFKRELMVVAFATLTLMVVGCAKKKVAAAPPPPPPSSAAAPAERPAAQPQQRASSRPAPVTAEAPRPRMPDAATQKRIQDLLARIEDAFFDYDKHNLRPDAIQALQADSTELRNILKDFPDYKLTIEGHCDERGSAEYNVALGEKRAESAKDYLVQVGIPGGQLHVISYGKEKPVCTDADETCWQKNRRIHIVAMAQ